MESVWTIKRSTLKSRQEHTNDTLNLADNKVFWLPSWGAVSCQALREHQVRRHNTEFYAARKGKQRLSGVESRTFLWNIQLHIFHCSTGS